MVLTSFQLPRPEALEAFMTSVFLSDPGLLGSLLTLCSQCVQSLTGSHQPHSNYPGPSHLHLTPGSLQWPPNWASCFPSCLCVIQSLPSQKSGFLNTTSGGLTLVLQTSSGLPSDRGLSDRAACAPLTYLLFTHSIPDTPASSLILGYTRHIPPQGLCSCCCSAPGSP